MQGGGAGRRRSAAHKGSPHGVGWLSAAGGSNIWGRAREAADLPWSNGPVLPTPSPPPAPRLLLLKRAPNLPDTPRARRPPRAGYGPGEQAALLGSSDPVQQERLRARTAESVRFVRDFHGLLLLELPPPPPAALAAAASAAADAAGTEAEGEAGAPQHPTTAPCPQAPATAAAALLGGLERQREGEGATGLPRLVGLEHVGVGQLGHLRAQARACFVSAVGRLGKLLHA